MDKQKLAAQLAGVLTHLSECCIKAANGDREAKQQLRLYTDKYWHGLVIGAHEIEELSRDREFDEQE